MKSKSIKVSYSTQAGKGSGSWYGGTEVPIPKIQMSGKWLEDLGFHIGDRLKVEYGEGSIHISPAAPVVQAALICEAPDGYAADAGMCNGNNREG